MLISVKIDSDSLVEMLIERLKVWTGDEDTIDAFSKMYENSAESGVFENADISERGIWQIVDNDWVNWVSAVAKEDVSDEDWEALQKMQSGDLSECESPLESLECNKGFLEVITDSVALIRA